MSRLIFNTDNLSEREKLRMRKYLNVKGDENFLDSLRGIVNLTSRYRAVNLRRAYRAVADEYNKEVLETREKKKIERAKIRKEKLEKKKADMQNVLWNYTFETIRVGKNVKKGKKLNEWDRDFNKKNGYSKTKDVAKDAFNDYLETIKAMLALSPIDYFFTPNGVKITAPKTDEAWEAFDDILKASFNILNYINVMEIKKPVKKSKIKDAGAINLDGFIKNDVWDTQSNKCVPDWIMYKYKNIKGFKKSVKDYDTIQKIATENLVIEDDFSSNFVENYKEMLDPNKYGYTIHHLKNFCFNIGIPLYTLNDGRLDVYQNKCADGVSLKRYPLIVEIKNNHLYPIIDEKKINSLKKTASNIHKPEKARSNLFHKKEETEESNENKEIVFNKNHTAPFQYLIEQMEKEDTMIYENKINLINGQLVSFELNDRKHIINYDADMNEYFGDDYVGQNPVSLLTPYIKDIPKSYMNIQVQNALELHTKSHIKNRTHHDINYKYDIDDEDIVKLDINKCYKYVMINPLEDWLYTDFNSGVNIKNKYDGKFGLYFIQTEDTTLFHKSNWYSNSIIEKGLKENIEFEIKYFINGYGREKNMLKEIIDTIEDDIENKDIKKLIINCISGYMGKTRAKRSKLMVDTDDNKVWENFYKKRQFENNKPYTYRKNEYVFYGESYENVAIENNLPIYIQILDQANILLYDKIKQTEGELVGRKVDAFIVYKPTNIILSDEIGGLKLEEKSSIFPSVHNHVNYEYKPPVKNRYDDIIDSNDYQAIIDLLNDNKSIMLLGRAGVGKTYVLNKIIEYYGDKCMKTAFTNKATLNLQGDTIHRLLKIDKQNRICKKTIQHITKHIELIIIDEIGMIPSYLWKHLDYIKENCGVKFICAGCYRQLPPIEELEGYKDYFNHPTILNICDNNIIELSVVKRYDHELLNVSNDVYEGKIKCFKKSPINQEDIINAKQNICWTNKTRKAVNKICNKHNAKNKENILIPYEGTENKYNEDIILYKGCKLLANMNDVDNGIRKNETFIVKDFDDKYIYLTTDEKYSELNDDIEYTKLYDAMMDSLKKRASGCLVDTPEATAWSDYITANNIKIENPIIIKIDKLHNYFILGYCITTYKSQGDTYKGKIVIFESNMMFDDVRHIYTAITRTDKYSNLIFM
tara:strand:- start:362 stop:3817 length:3456 start_codon:yes stop_codon:yes gene_type:complete